MDPVANCKVFDSSYTYFFKNSEKQFSREWMLLVPFIFFLFYWEKMTTSYLIYILSNKELVIKEDH